MVSVEIGAHRHGHADLHLRTRRQAALRTALPAHRRRNRFRTPQGRRAPPLEARPRRPSADQREHRGRRLPHAGGRRLSGLAAAQRLLRPGAAPDPGRADAAPRGCGDAAVPGRRVPLRSAHGARRSGHVPAGPVAEARAKGHAADGRASRRRRSAGRARPARGPHAPPARIPRARRLARPDGRGRGHGVPAWPAREAHRGRRGLRARRSRLPQVAHRARQQRRGTSVRRAGRGGHAPRPAPRQRRRRRLRHADAPVSDGDHDARGPPARTRRLGGGTARTLYRRGRL